MEKREVKCDRCCIGAEDSCDDGIYLVDEGFDGDLGEEFTFCPHCGIKLPEYVKPKMDTVKYGGVEAFRSAVDKAIYKFYLPAIKDMLKTPLLFELLEKEE